MMKKHQHIDDLYKDNFSNYSITPVSNHWENVYKKASKKIFFKPDYKKFNFIYAFLIASTFIISLSVFIDYFFINDNLITPFNSQQIVFDSSIVNTIYIRDTIYHRIALKNNYKKGIYIDTAEIIDSYLNKIKIEEIKSLEFICKKPDTAEYKSQSSKQKNISIIYKTIEKKDTVILYKEKPGVTEKIKGIFEVRNR